MEEIVQEHLESGLERFLTFVPIVYVIIVLLTSFIFMPVAKRRKSGLDDRLVVLLVSCFWILISIWVYPSEFFTKLGVLKLLIGTILSIFIIHLKFIKWKR